MLIISCHEPYFSLSFWLFGGCPFWKNKNYLKKFCLVKLIVKRITSCDFWAYKQPGRIYRPGFIDKHDHVICWNKDRLSQVSWLGKKTTDFSTFNSCLYITEMISELWNMYGSSTMTSVNNIFFKKYLWFHTKNQDLKKTAYLLILLRVALV